MIAVDTISANLKLFVASLVPSLVLEKKDYGKVVPLMDKLGDLLKETGYMHIQATKPDTVGLALTTSPLGTVFENPPKSLIQHCERSELRLHIGPFWRVFEKLKVSVKQCFWVIFKHCIMFEILRQNEWFIKKNLVREQECFK